MQASFAVKTSAHADSYEASQNVRNRMTHESKFY